MDADKAPADGPSGEKKGAAARVRRFRQHLQLYSNLNTRYNFSERKTVVYA